MPKQYVDAAELLAEHAGTRTEVWFHDPPQPPSTYVRGTPQEFGSLRSCLEAIRNDLSDRTYYRLIVHPLGEDDIPLPGPRLSIADMLDALD